MDNRKRKAKSQLDRRLRTRHVIDRDDISKPPLQGEYTIHNSRASVPTRSGVLFRTTYIPKEVPPTRPDPPLSEAVAEFYDHVDQDASEYVIQVDGGKRKKYSSDEPLQQWIPHRQEYLDHLLELEGRGKAMHDMACKHCKNGSKPEYRCDECNPSRLRCLECVLSSHEEHPLHRIEFWNGHYFVPKTLQELGLQIYLGHNGELCPKSKACHKDFVVVDTYSVQRINLNFCECEDAEPRTKQLMRFRWYPATSVRPSTAVTFAALNYFHLSTLQSKQSAYDFYTTAARMTDNTGLKPPPDRYRTFLRVVREWRHLKSLKRFGRAQVPAGVAMTTEGDLAMPCPACPQPGVNLPENWEEAAKDKQWLYSLILAMDANFRLRRKNISNDEADPPLGSGWAYFVNNEGYKIHLKNNGAQSDMSTCSNLAAISQANRHDRGLATTGVGACICARHQMIRANGVADLQRGERFCNMDYLFFSTLRAEKIRSLITSYDVSCQWYKHLWKRMEELPRAYQLDLSRVSVRFVVPKFHLSAHVESCQSMFSFNYCRGVGRTDGEGIERDWAMINPVAYSTREMTPGHRADTLDDHWGDWNWRKVSGMGTDLVRRYREAIQESRKHEQLFREMNVALELYPTEEWEKAVMAWEEETANKLPCDVEVPNPYEQEKNKITQAAVRLQLAQDDALRYAAGTNDTGAMHEISQAKFLIAGIDLQEQQQRIVEDRNHLAEGTSIQRANLQERRNTLRRRLDEWFTIQAVYMPGIAELAERLVLQRPSSEQPEDESVLLPSSAAQHGFQGNENLMKAEMKLREGQAHDALRQVRHYVQTLSFLWTDKHKNARGQRENTRSHTLIKRTENKKKSSVDTYRRAFNALRSLDPEGSWSASLKELKNEDVRNLTDPEGGETEGRRMVSWIWRAPGIGSGEEGDDMSLNSSLRVEWCKARARAMRWGEEAELLNEEMLRVTQWLMWRKTWWEHLSRCRPEESPELVEGLCAYALRQADLQEQMRSTFVKLFNEATGSNDST